jgi:hypothetical protein
MKRSFPYIVSCETMMMLLYRLYLQGSHYANLNSKICQSTLQVRYVRFDSIKACLEYALREKGPRLQRIQQYEGPKPQNDVAQTRPQNVVIIMLYEEVAYGFYEPPLMSLNFGEGCGGRKACQGRVHKAEPTAAALALGSSWRILHLWIVRVSPTLMTMNSCLKQKLKNGGLISPVAHGDTNK